MASSSSSSLSSVVSSLVRAQMGTSLAPTVTEEDLDRHVAELILKEAKKKAERYGQQGIRAYISSNSADPNAPRPNKRFLTSIIKSTDDHNKAVLRNQALAAEELKRERAEQERRERRRRAEEAVDAEKQRRSERSSKRRRVADDEGWDRWDGRTADRKKVARRDWETWDGSEDRDDQSEGRDKGKQRHRERSRSRDRSPRGDKRSRSRDRTSSKRARERSRSPRRESRRDEERDGERRERRRERSKERHRKRSRSWESGRDQSRERRKRQSRSREYSDGEERRKRSRRSSRSPPRHALDDIPDYTRRTSPTPGKSNPRDASPATSTAKSVAHRSSPPPPPPPPRHRRSPTPELSEPESPGPQPAVKLPSKMDKYFEESYDPRLDVTPLSTVPNVPATGLIDNAEFEGWDHMLEVLRHRQQAKEEKKRMERLGLIPKDKDKSKTKKKGSTVVISSSSAATTDRWDSEHASVMDIKYAKRGTVREWDMGKETPT